MLSIITRFKIRLVLGMSLMSLAFCMYFIYQQGGGSIFYLPPIGISLFVVGFWIGFSKTNIYRKFGTLLPFVAVAVFMTWVAWDVGIHDFIVNSQYGYVLSGIARENAIITLDTLGIHASNIGNQIILPASSKVHSFDVVNSCSGADTTVLFLGAFSLMLTDIGRKYTSSKKKIAVCFVLGGLGTYATAIMRIPLLGIIGNYFGFDTLETFHAYSGYLIFMASVTVFWWLSMRWIKGKKEIVEEKDQNTETKQIKNNLQI
jgi:exosortase/archaeosortase family protein